MKEFSKKILKHAVKKGIPEKELNDNYQNLISDYYEYDPHVFFLNELDKYMVKYRTELFYAKKKKATFWLLMDYHMYFTLKSIPVYDAKSSKKQKNKISKDSNLQEIYLFLKESLFYLKDKFYDNIVAAGFDKWKKYEGEFAELLWDIIFEYLKIDPETRENIKEKLEYFYLFDYALEDFCEENDLNT